jgi:hypothetical protein
VTLFPARRTASPKRLRQSGEGKRAIRPRPDWQAPELSVEEDARRRYLELLVREKLANQQRVQR